MISSQKLPDEEVNSLISLGWSIINLAGGVKKEIWENLVEAYDKIGKDTYKIVSYEETENVVTGIILLAPAFTIITKLGG